MSNLEKSMGVFREEAVEHLADMESALLELEKSPGDVELVQRIFRSVHTLKGSSSMFGFDDLASVAHVLEDLFELVRQDRMEITKGFIEASLSAKDTMSAIVKALEVNGGNWTGQVEKILDVLNGHKPEAGGEHPPFTPPASNLAASGELGDRLAEKTYRISFKPGPDIFKRGINLTAIIEEIKELGSCEVSVFTDKVPSIELLDPFSSHLYWEITLTTDKGEAAIRDIFIFVEDDSEISISEVGLAGPDSKEQTNMGAEASENEHGGSSRPLDDNRASIRVPAERLDQMVNLVGELVTLQARLKQTVAHDVQSDVYYISEDIERLTEDLRENAMSLRMLPIGMTFGWFKRVARDLSGDLGKEVEFITEGGDTELDKGVIERLNDPLVHIIRNCLDHGVEDPALREAAGKPRAGRIHLSAEHSTGNVLIHIKDDGAGIDLEKVRATAAEKGLIAAEDSPSREELLSLIFEPGFSTASSVSNVSGRGVGMDVVKRNVENLRGAISIDSAKGEGTTLTIRIPLTLAIIDGLLVQIGDGFYVIPLSEVDECMEIRRNELTDTGRGNLAEVRGNLVPYIPLRDAFGVLGDIPNREQVVITGTNGSRVGFVVDSVVGEHQTVIKSLGNMYRDVKEISGATILGNGTVALILDINQMVSDAERERKTAGKMN